MLDHIRTNAEKKGMLVNEKKTSLMCVSAARGYQAKVKIDFNGQYITGQE